MGTYMIDTFPGCTVLYTDTDWLVYELHQYPYEMTRRDCHQRSYTSNYPPDNIWGIRQVKLVMMTDECAVHRIQIMSAMQFFYLIENI